MANCWIIASGKGGVGKTMLTAALGHALTELGKSVCIVDADIGLRDQDLVLNLQDRVVYDLLDVCESHCDIELALIPSPTVKNLSLLPAAQFARVGDLESKHFKKAMKQLRTRFEWILIDCPAGVEKGLRNVLRAELDGGLLVVTPDDVCIRNAERTAALLRDKQQPSPGVVVNRLHADLVASGEMYSAKTVAETLDLHLLGEIPDDPAVYRALLQKRSLLDQPSEAAEAVRRIARRMTGEEVPYRAYGQPKPGWWARLWHRKGGIS